MMQNPVYFLWCGASFDLHLLIYNIGNITLGFNDTHENSTDNLLSSGERFNAFELELHLYFFDKILSTFKTAMEKLSTCAGSKKLIRKGYQQI
jgi:hypothetical protein